MVNWLFWLVCMS